MLWLHAVSEWARFNVPPNTLYAVMFYWCKASKPPFSSPGAAPSPDICPRGESRFTPHSTVLFLRTVVNVWWTLPSSSLEALRNALYKCYSNDTNILFLTLYQHRFVCCTIKLYTTTTTTTITTTNTITITTITTTYLLTYLLTYSRLCLHRFNLYRARVKTSK